MTEWHGAVPYIESTLNPHHPINTWFLFQNTAWSGRYPVDSDFRSHGVHPQAQGLLFPAGQPWHARVNLCLPWEGYGSYHWLYWSGTLLSLNKTCFQHVLRLYPYKSSRYPSTKDLKRIWQKGKKLIFLKKIKEKAMALIFECVGQVLVKLLAYSDK